MYHDRRIAYNLQNPYTLALPKFGISVIEYPRNSIGLHILQQAEVLTGLKGVQGNIVNDISKFLENNDLNREVSTTNEIRKAMNTFLLFFGKKDYDFKNLTQALTYILRSDQRRSEQINGRLVDFLYYAGQVDLYYDFFGFLRDQNNIKDGSKPLN